MKPACVSYLFTVDLLSSFGICCNEVYLNTESILSYISFKNCSVLFVIDKYTKNAIGSSVITNYI